MGQFPSRIPINSPPPLSNDELHSLVKRRVVTAEALIKHIKNTNPQLAEALNNIPEGQRQLPRIGVAMSGGGWRAMTAATAATDALSQEGFLDAVEVVAGLSGGSWFVQQWALGGDGTTGLPLHSTGVVHPWARGKQFNPDVHRYHGLTTILSDKVANQAAKVPALVNAFGKFVNIFTSSDLLFFQVILTSTGGNTMITRYESLLKDQLFVWMPPQQRDSATIQNEAIRRAISNGTFPMLVVAAIDTVEENEVPQRQRNNTPGQKLKPLSQNVWTEFSPFGARSVLLAGGNTQNISEMIALTKKNFICSDDVAELNSGLLAAICGSAFALDKQTLLANLPKPVARIATLLGVDDEQDEIVLSKAVTTTFVNSKSTGKKSVFGTLRDAGLDFNIPFPTLLKPSSGRELDILIAFDAGHGAVSAAELATAVKYNYIELDGVTDAQLRESFPPELRVKVYSPKNRATDPIIIYVLLLTVSKSSQIVYTPEEVTALTALARSIVQQQLVPILNRCIDEWVVAHNSLSADDLLVDYTTQEVNLELPTTFSAVAREALTAYMLDPTVRIRNTPLDLVQAVEWDRLRTLQLPAGVAKFDILRQAALHAVKFLDPNVASIALPREGRDQLDELLVSNRWLVSPSNNDLDFVFLDSTLRDYTIAVVAAKQLLRYAIGQAKENDAETRRLLAAALNRGEALVQPLAAHITVDLQLNNGALRFVYSFLGMLGAVMPDLSKALIQHLQAASSALLTAPNALQPLQGLTQEQFLRYDQRQQVRQQLGINVVVETMCFLTESDKSCAADRLLFGWWEKYLLSKQVSTDGRFAYIVLEQVLFNARGNRCTGLVKKLASTATVMCNSVKPLWPNNAACHLLRNALYGSSFRNTSNIEVLRTYVEGNPANRGQGCTLYDAVNTGNHNAVEAILTDITTGAPALDIVQLAIDRGMPKCLELLILDAEATKDYVINVTTRCKGCSWPTVQSALSKQQERFGL